MSLAQLLDSAEPRADGFALTIPESWHQGRTAFGGLTAALALVAARQAGGEGLPPLRSAQVSLVGPMYGAVELRARVLRAGRNVTWIAAELLRNGEVGLTATFAFMRPIESGLHLGLEREFPDVIPVEQAIPREEPRGSVRLFEHIEARFALPRQDEPSPEICWWVRAKDREGVDPALHLLLCADAPPPGVFPIVPRPIPPISSMTWLANFLSPDPRSRDGWLLLRTVGDFAYAGYSSDRTEIWNSDGVPLLLGMQSVAIFG